MMKGKSKQFYAWCRDYVKIWAQVFSVMAVLKMLRRLVQSIIFKK